MDRQAIVKRVADKVWSDGCEWKKFATSMKGQVETILESAGFFELLEAAEKINNCEECSLNKECAEELYYAVKKAKGA